MKLGILAAMEEEIAMVMDEVENPVKWEIADRIFYEGKMNGVDCVVSFSKWGKVAAAITATLMAEHFHISHLVFVGTAGALSDELNVGDIVVAQRLVQHDLDARPIIPRFQIPLTDKMYMPTDDGLTNLAMQTIQDLLKREFKEIVGEEAYREFDFIRPVLFSGDVASGDQFISTDEKRQELIGLLPEVKCVEMEGAAVAQVCVEFNLPFTVIRIISDKADHDARVDFGKFIHFVANVYSKSIIVELTQKIATNIAAM